LAQFQREHEILGAASGLERRHSFGGEKETNSVHGSNVFQNARRNGANSMVAMGKKSDNLNNSWHLGQSGGGGGGGGSKSMRG
jgi:hypothetical protein